MLSAREKDVVRPADSPAKGEINTAVCPRQLTKIEGDCFTSANTISMKDRLHLLILILTYFKNLDFEVVHRPTL